jgi:uncharacterized protein YbaP (TraB family)
MTKKSLLLAAGMLSATVVFSQAGQTGQTGQTEQTAGTMRTPHTLLWRISGNGITRPSWLFGTMHILCAKDAMLSDSLKAVIAECDEVYFEINLSDMSGMINALQYMRMNGNEKLSDLLKPKDYARVKDYFTQHVPIPPFSMLERFKPMLLSGMIEEQGLGCETTDGVELQIMKTLKEQEQKKPINGLETAAFQAGLFDSIPYEKQAKELVDYLDSMDQNKKITQQLATLYTSQDLDGIQALSDKDDPEMNGYMDLLLYNRNRKWAKELDSLLRGKSLLIAVGAGHLPGREGVIELLRAEGYTVEPVKNR